MIKTLALIKRRPDITRADFRNHYETIHAPLALPLMVGLVRYVRYHLEEDLLGEIDFDVLSAFWYRDAAAVLDAMKSLEAEAGKPILEDELKFMDKPANTFFSVSERRLVEGAAGDGRDEGDEHLFVLVRKPAAVSRYDFSLQLVETHWPRLLGGMQDVGFALLRDAFPIRGDGPVEPGESIGRGELRYNAVLQIRAARFAGLEGWAAELEGLGYRVAAIRARRFETKIA